MTRIIAISDTHMENELSKSLLELAGGADIILHAGDFVSKDIYDSLADLGRIEAVCGNADLPEIKRLLPARAAFEVDGVKIGLVHMASHSPGPGAKMLAREMEVDILVFGHLHRPYIERDDKILLCPGSPTVPRMSPPTAAVIEIDDGKVRMRLLPLGEPSCDYLRYADSLIREGKIDGRD
jgi:putative phosphoesterase